MLKTSSRLVVAFVASLGMVFAAAGSANAADSTLWLNDDRGYMHHYDPDPDLFEVCDTKADGYGVTGGLEVLNLITGTWDVLLQLLDGGDAQCATYYFDVIKGEKYRMKLCWHGGGACVTKALEE